MRETKEKRKGRKYDTHTQMELCQRRDLTEKGDLVYVEQVSLSHTLTLSPSFKCSYHHTKSSLSLSSISSVSSPQLSMDVSYSLKGWSKRSGTFFRCSITSWKTERCALRTGGCSCRNRGRFPIVEDIFVSESFKAPKWIK